MYGPDTNFYSKGITSPATYPYYGSGDMSVSSTGTETITGEFAPSSSSSSPAYCSANIKITSGGVPVFGCTLSAPSSAVKGANFSLVINVTGSGTGTVQVYDPTGSISKNGPGFSSPGSDSWTPSISVTGKDTITGQFTPTDTSAQVAYCEANINITAGGYSCSVTAPPSEPINTSFSISVAVTGSGNGMIAVNDSAGYIVDRTFNLNPAPGSHSWTVLIKSAGNDTIGADFYVSGQSSPVTSCHAVTDITSSVPQPPPPNIPTFTCSIIAPGLVG